MISLPASSRSFSSWVALRLRASCSIFKSPPAQNARPAPVITTARTVSSRLARNSDFTSPRAMSAFSAFRRSGRFSRIVNTVSDRSSRTHGFPVTWSCAAGLAASVMGRSASAGPRCVVTLAMPGQSFSCFTNAASFFIYRIFTASSAPPFCPLVDGSTNTIAPYNLSFCRPSLHGRPVNFS